MNTFNLDIHYNAHRKRISKIQNLKLHNIVGKRISCSVKHVHKFTGSPKGLTHGGSNGSMMN